LASGPKEEDTTGLGFGSLKWVFNCKSIKLRTGLYCNGFNLLACLINSETCRPWICLLSPFCSPLESHCI